MFFRFFGYCLHEYIVLKTDAFSLVDKLYGSNWYHLITPNRATFLDAYVVQVQPAILKNKTESNTYHTNSVGLVGSQLGCKRGGPGSTPGRGNLLAPMRETRL